MVVHRRHRRRGADLVPLVSAMLDLSKLLTAPRQHKFRVVMERKRGLNENQNARTVAEEVFASDELEAKAKASKARPEFFAIEVRKV